METMLKPVRIPNEYTSKYLYTHAMPLLLAWCGVGVIIGLLQLPDNTIFPCIGLWFLTFFAMLCYPLCFDRIVFPEGVQVRLFGKVIRQIPVSDFKILCAVGNDREQYLCLSIWSLEELAARREAVLQRGCFSRQDLPFLKRNPGWQERFAKEYLLNPRRYPRNYPIIWLPFDPAVAIFLRRIYPQLPYVDLRSPMMGCVSLDLWDQIPFSGERYRIDESGIHILGEVSRTERRCFRAERIKTILRVDQFVSAARREHAYGCYLVISELSLKELAQRGKRKGWQKWKKQMIAQLPEAEELYAAEFHFSGMFIWDWRNATDCHVRYSPETEALLRQLYPHARWVDYSHKWQ